MGTARTGTQTRAQMGCQCRKTEDQSLSHSLALKSVVSKIFSTNRKRKFGIVPQVARLVICLIKRISSITFLLPNNPPDITVSPSIGWSKTLHSLMVSVPATTDSSQDGLVILWLRNTLQRADVWPSNSDSDAGILCQNSWIQVLPQCPISAFCKCIPTRQQVMNQVPKPLAPTWEIWNEFQASTWPRPTLQRSKSVDGKTIYEPEGGRPTCPCFQNQPVK